jgi:hypothetical protein
MFNVCIAPPESRFLPFLELMDLGEYTGAFPESRGIDEFL